MTHKLYKNNKNWRIKKNTTQNLNWVISLAINMRFTCIACSLQDYVQLHMCIILCLTSEILSFIINTKKKK